jgi:hypothetical protein
MIRGSGRHSWNCPEHTETVSYLTLVLNSLGCGTHLRRRGVTDGGGCLVFALLRVHLMSCSDKALSPPHPHP